MGFCTPRRKQMEYKKKKKKLESYSIRNALYCPPRKIRTRRVGSRFRKRSRILILILQCGVESSNPVFYSGETSWHSVPSVLIITSHQRCAVRNSDSCRKRGFSLRLQLGKLQNLRDDVTEGFWRSPHHHPSQSQERFCITVPQRSPYPANVDSSIEVFFFQ